MQTSDAPVHTSGVILRNAGRFVFQFGFNAARDALGVVRLGGHVEPGESPDQAAVREAFEEARTRVAITPSRTTFRYEEREAAIDLVPTTWGAGPPAPLLLADMTDSGVNGLSVTYLAESFDEPTPAAETQALAFLTVAEVRAVADSSISLGDLIESGGVVKDPSGLPRHLPLRPHGQMRALSILLARPYGDELAAGWSETRVVTDRLVLRPLNEDDQEALIALFTDPEVRRFVGGPMTAEAAKSATTVKGERWGHFMICDQVTGSVIGTVSFARKDVDWDLSYQLAKSHWGQGLATEAVQAALRWFFGETDAPVVTALTQEANVRSIQLLHRLGGSVTERTMYRDQPQLKFAISR